MFITKRNLSSNNKYGEKNLKVLKTLGNINTTTASYASFCTTTTTKIMTCKYQHKRDYNSICDPAVVMIYNFII